MSREDTVGQRRELEADCMAGIFFGLEVGWVRNLDEQDAVEAYYQLYDQGWSPSHGSGAERASAFWSGYVAKSWYQCDISY